MTAKLSLCFLLLNLAVAVVGRAAPAKLPSYWQIGRLFPAEDPRNDRVLVVVGRKERQISTYIWRPADPENPRSGGYTPERRFYGSRNLRSSRATPGVYRVRFSSRLGPDRFSGVITFQPRRKNPNQLRAKVTLPATPLLNLSRPQTVMLRQGF